jgi:hypothetical protein
MVYNAEMNEQELSFFHSRVEESQSGCWLWRGGLTGGYGTIRLKDSPLHDGRTRAHRAAYEHFVAPIAAGMQLHHLCAEKTCVNPEHTTLEMRKNKCVRGHDLNDPKNAYFRKTIRRPNETGRMCRACDRERKREARNYLGTKYRSKYQ